MANPTIDWGTRVITVPKSFLTLLGGSAYSLDTNLFHIALKDLEDDEAGITYPQTHTHNTTVTLGGIQYARIIEMINGYTVTFEDGVYSVSLIGSNNNILDVTNLNQVSVRANNSAGLINVFEIQLAAFDGRVTIDVANGIAGTGYPAGTRATPVNNLADALTIAQGRGFNKLQIESSITIASGEVIDDYTLVADDWAVEVTLAPGSSCINTQFEKISVRGVMSGEWNVLVDCWGYVLTNFKGWLRGGSFEDISLAPYFDGEHSFFDDIVPMYPATYSIIRMNTVANMAATKMNGYFLLENLAAGSVVTFGMESGVVKLAPTCTGGELVLSGTGVIVDNSTGTTVDIDGFINGTNMVESLMVQVQANPMPANVLMINTAPVIGDGTAGNDWRGSGVPPTVV